MISDTCYVCNNPIRHHVYRAYDKTMCCSMCQNKLVNSYVYDDEYNIISKYDFYYKINSNKSYANNINNFKYDAKKDIYNDENYINIYSSNITNKICNIIYPSKILKALKYIPAITSHSINSINYIISKSTNINNTNIP